MAKNKHQKLADLMKHMLFLDKATKIASTIQVISITGVILIRPESMTLKRIPICRKRRRQLSEDFINRENERLKMLLYAPAKSEYSYEIDWYENDDAANSFTHKLLTIQAHQDEGFILRQNLQQDPLEFYQQSIQEWRDLPSASSDPDNVYEVAVEPANLESIEFAPRPGQTLETAYKAILLSIRSGKFKHRQPLRKIYKKKLEQAMFKGLQWQETQRRKFLKELKKEFFGGFKSCISTNHGRWNQCKGIDRYTAARFIEHFVLKFIKNPSDRWAGETACVLWLLIWCAQEDVSHSITLEQVLELSSKDISEEDQGILFKTTELEVSAGLHRLLICLCGLGNGERKRRIFANVNQKSLERILHVASKEILGVTCTPVLPASFLISPHQYPNVRMTCEQRKMMKEARQLVPFRYTRHEVLAALKQAQNPLNLSK